MEETNVIFNLARLARRGQMLQVNMFQAKTELSKLIKSLEDEEHKSIVIARNGQPVAKLTLYDASESSKRELGKFNGKYHIPEDIDECNDEVLALMEGRT